MIGNDVLRGTALVVLGLVVILFRPWLARTHAEYVRRHGLGKGKSATAWCWILGSVVVALGAFILTVSLAGRW